LFLVSSLILDKSKDMAFQNFSQIPFFIAQRPNFLKQVQHLNGVIERAFPA
jgi:hypothetical protein